MRGRNADRGTVDPFSRDARKSCHEFTSLRFDGYANTHVATTFASIAGRDSAPVSSSHRRNWRSINDNNVADNGRPTNFDWTARDGVSGGEEQASKRQGFDGSYTESNNVAGKNGRRTNFDWTARDGVNWGGQTRIEEI